MSAGQTLWREILEHPDDDAPRIVYADWLEENALDDETRARAALIHAQIDLEHAAPADRPALQTQIRALMQKYRRRWTDGMTRAKIRGSWRFRRGFLDGGTMSADRFVRVADQIFVNAPLLRSMVFPEASNELEKLAACPYLERLVEVDLEEMCRCGSCPIERELPSLFASKHAVNIRMLSLADDRIEPDNARKLFESSHLRAVVTLDLRENHLDVTSMEVLAARGGQFERLVLAANPIRDAGVVALAEARELSIAHLDLSHVGCTEIGARALADCAWGDSIQMLVLRGNKVGKARTALRSRFGNRLKL